MRKRVYLSIEQQVDKDLREMTDILKSRSLSRLAEGYLKKGLEKDKKQLLKTV